MRPPRIARSLIASLALAVTGGGCGATGGEHASVVPVAKVDAKAAPAGPALPCAMPPDAELLDEADSVGKKVTEMCVHGVPESMHADVRVYLRTKPGKVLDAIRLHDDVKTLFDSGFFKRVQVIARSSGSGVELHVDLDLRPVVRALTFENAPNLPADDEAREMYRRNGYFDPTWFRRQLASLHDRYVSWGFENATVTSAITPDGADGARLRIIVAEGTRSTIGRVSIEGASAGLEVDLRKIPELAPGSPNTESTREAVRARGVEICRDRGHLRATLVLVRGARAADGSSPITLTVREGPRFRIGRLRVTAKDPAVAKALLAKVQSKSGELVDRTKLRADIDRAIAALNALGKDDVSFEMLTDQVTTTLNVSIEVR